LHEKGICNWFEEPKEIPKKVIIKGCKFWRDDRAQYVIENYGGKLITRRRYAKSRW